MKNAILAGAIAGIIPFLTYRVYWATGIWEQPPYIDTIFDHIYQLIVHMGNNAFWGALFGLTIIFAFDRIPGKGIKKGLIIGLIYCSLAIFYPVSTYLTLELISGVIEYLMNGPIDKFVYGILFVFIYEKLLRK